jgi:hypothetical protein
MLAVGIVATRRRIDISWGSAVSFKIIAAEIGL